MGGKATGKAGEGAADPVERGRDTLPPPGPVFTRGGTDSMHPPAKFSPVRPSVRGNGAKAHHRAAEMRRGNHGDAETGKRQPRRNAETGEGPPRRCGGITLSLRG